MIITEFDREKLRTIRTSLTHLRQYIEYPTSPENLNFVRDFEWMLDKLEQVFSLAITNREYPQDSIYDLQQALIFLQSRMDKVETHLVDHLAEHLRELENDKSKHD